MPKPTAHLNWSRTTRTCFGTASTAWKRSTPSWGLVAKRFNAERPLRGESRSPACGTMDEKEFHGIARGDLGEAQAGSFDGYLPLVVEIMKFFKTGVAPVRPEETLEIVAFMEAADQSKREGGVPVSVAEVLKRARAMP